MKVFQTCPGAWRLGAGALLLAMAFAAAGCIGMYDNKSIFFLEPKPGMSEAEILQTYGTPAYAGFAEDQKIYTFRVRDNKYIICVGIYEGYDLVITCDNGVISQVDRVKRPRTFTLFQPLPWGEDYR